MTVEFALALPAALVVLVAMLAGVQASVVHVRVADLAADAARALARGDTVAATSPAFSGLVDVAIEVSRPVDLVCARVSATVPGLAALSPLRVSGRSCAADGGW